MQPLTFASLGAAQAYAAPIGAVIGLGDASGQLEQRGVGLLLGRAGGDRGQEGGRSDGRGSGEQGAAARPSREDQAVAPNAGGRRPTAA
jgi:hypothetical protein